MATRADDPTTVSVDPSTLAAAGVVVDLERKVIVSLRLNARDHEKVAEVCRTEAQRPGGPARRCATEAVADDAPPFAL